MHDAMLGDLEDFIRSVSDAAGEEAPKFRRSDLAEHLSSFLDQVEDGDAEFAFGLPTPYEEGKHPRGYGGRWTNAVHAALNEDTHRSVKELAKDTGLDENAVSTALAHLYGQGHVESRTNRGKVGYKRKAGAPVPERPAEGHAEVSHLLGQGKLLTRKQLVQATQLGLHEVDRILADLAREGRLDSGNVRGQSGYRLVPSSPRPVEHTAATSPAAPAPSSSSAQSSDQVEHHLEAVVRQLAAHAEGEQVRIHALRAHFPQLPRQQFDAALIRLSKQHRVRLVPIGDYRDFTEEQLAESIPGANEVLGYVKPVHPEAGFSLWNDAYLAPGGQSLFVPGPAGTAAFDEVALDSDEALPWLERYHRRGQHPPEWPAAMPLPEEPIDLEALAQEVRLGQAAERVEQALETHRATPEGLASWTQEALDNARTVLQEVRGQHASLVSFSQEEADEDSAGLSAEVQAWWEAVEDGRVVLPDADFAFGLPHPYEEHKHPRGYGGKWTNKPGAAEAAAAHQAAEKNLRKHETRLGKLAAKLAKLHQAHEEAKAAHTAAKKRAPKGKPHSREALEAHKAELAKIKAKGKFDAAKAAHAATKKDHAAAKKEHTRTAKALEKMKHEEPSRVRAGGPGSPAKSDKAGRSVAPETSGTTAPAVDREPPGGGVPAGPAAPARIPVSVEEATRRIDRYAAFFQEKGQEEQARWMEMLRDHVQAVGTSAALQSLGEEIGTGGEPREEIQYQGAHEEMSQFADHYLRRHGITPLVGSAAPTEATKRFVSSWTPAEEPVPAGRSGAGDFKPRDPTLTNKLEEAKHLPGLESSEDLEVLMGKPVTHLDASVSARMDEQYGKGQWIIKAYGEDAFAGFGIFFPQRIAQLTKDAQDTIWNAGEHLAPFGLSLRRQDGKVVGLEHQDGRRFDFGSADYQRHIYGDARHLGDKVAQVADNEHGVALRDRDGRINGKHWMAQPAFPVVGVSEAERAQGVTIKKGSEGRVHLVTRDGNVEIVPHATWLKEEHLPVVFENEDTRAMAEAARKAIAALPDSERQGQVYAPDVVKTAQGFRVIEANPEAKGGGSGYLEDNPFIIDSYISHLVGREPAHVTFLRDLLT